MAKLLQTYRQRLNTFLLLSIGAGILVGWFAPGVAATLSLPGEFFLRLLTVLIVPVITLSITSGVLNIGSAENLSRLGIKTLAYYMLTTALAVLTGLLLVNLIAPGAGAPMPAEASSAPVVAHAGIADVLRSIVPLNIVSAAAEGNVLGLIFFSIFFSAALLHIKHPGTADITRIIAAMFDAAIWMVDKVLLLAPPGVFCLVAEKVGEFHAAGTLDTLGESLGWYVVTVVLGLVLHGVMTLPLIGLAFRVSPRRLVIAMAPALSTAFSTASSSGTLPLTIDLLERRAGVSNRITSFVAPLGATVNMDGTAIYEAVAAVFIANMYGVALGPGEQITVFLTATFASIGAAGIPGAGLIMLSLILNSVGVPVEGIALIIGVDRFLDMLRTCINVWGDCVGAALIAVSEGETILQNP